MNHQCIPHRWAGAKVATTGRIPGLRRVASRGFTLIELLVVISIISLLIALLLPALGKARDVAQMTRCQSQMHQQGIALETYSADNRNYYPAPYGPDNSSGTLYQRRSWAYAIWDYTQSGSFVYPDNDLQGNSGRDANMFTCPITKALQLNTPMPPLVAMVNSNVMSYAMNITPSERQYPGGAGDPSHPYRPDLILRPAAGVDVLEASFGWVDANAFNISWGCGLIPHDHGSNALFYDGHVEFRSLDSIPLYDGVYINYNSPGLDGFWTGGTQ